MDRSYEENQARADIKNRLPEMIMEAGLTVPGKWKGHSGEFYCPCCGKVLKLYERRAGINRWGINNLGHCPHFGDGGAYPNDAFGLYAALNNLTPKEAYIQLMTREGVSYAQTEEQKEARRQKREEIERKRAEENARRDAIKAENLRIVKTSTAWGDSIPSQGINLLHKRGIDFAAIPARIKDSIGFIKQWGLESLEGGKQYGIEGIAFRLGEGSIQVRRTHGDSYVGKDEKMSRFQTFGPSAPFCGECIKEDDRKEPVFIVEGPFDAIALYVSGAKRAVAVIGAGNHEYLLRLMRDSMVKRDIYLCFDPDETGSNQARELAEKLRSIPGTAVYQWPINGPAHDANDLLISDREELRNRVAIARGLTQLKAIGEADSGDIEAFAEDLRYSDTHRTPSDSGQFIKAIRSTWNMVQKKSRGGMER